MSEILTRSSVLWALEELSSREEQSRLWLSDGTSGEVSSFEEAVCEAFDGGVTKELESGAVPENVSLAFSELRSPILKMPASVPTSQIIDHPIMSRIRTKSYELATLLRSIS